MSGKIVRFFVISVFATGLSIPEIGHSSTSQDSLVATPSEETIRALLTSKDSPHPRLFLGGRVEDSLRSTILSNPRTAAEYQQLISRARAMLKEQPETRVLKGKRLLQVSRRCLKRVSTLSIAWRLDRDPVFLARAREEMLAAAAFADWNPSHFLDVAEMTAALAIGYDWLYHDLDEITREAVKKAIVTKGLEPSLRGPGGKEHKWFRGKNNWNQVCNGGLVLGALAVAEEQPELSSKVISRAVESVPFALNSYAPGGVYPEGPSYWGYGTTYTVLMISALQTALGSDFGLTEHPGFLESAEFILHATGPSGRYFNFSDGGSSSSIQPSIFWISSKKKDPSLLWNMERKQAANTLEPIDYLPFLLLWSDPTINASIPTALDWTADGPNPVAFMRSGWGKEDLYAAIKGGSPSLNHAHMDAGSFVFDALGTRWVHDLGSQDYTGLEQGGIDLWNMDQNSPRWSVFRLSSISHNNIVINGALQNVRGKASLKTHELGSTTPSTTVDCSEIYAGQAGAVVRTLSLPNRSSLLIEDRVNAMSASGSIRWQIMTDASVRTEGSKATLSKDSKSVILICENPTSAAWHVSDASIPAHALDAANPGMHQVFLDIPVKQGESLNIKITLQPQAAKLVTNKAP